MRFEEAITKSLKKQQVKLARTGRSSDSVLPSSNEYWTSGGLVNILLVRAPIVPTDAASPSTTLSTEIN